MLKAVLCIGSTSIINRLMFCYIIVIGSLWIHLIVLLLRFLNKLLEKQLLQTVPCQLIVVIATLGMLQGMLKQLSEHRRKKGIRFGVKTLTSCINRLL